VAAKVNLATSETIIICVQFNTVPY